MKKLDLEQLLSGEGELHEQLDCIMLAIANDLKLVNSGKLDKLKILNLDDKLYKRIADLLKVTKPQKTEKTEELPERVVDLPKDTKKTKFTLPHGGNIYEHVIKDVKNGRINV